jgi:predicted nucleotidyltransferase
MELQLLDMATKIRPVLRKYGIKRASVFGSYARGDATEESDVDILVTLGTQPLSAWDLVALKDELSAHLDKEVDIVSDRSVVPYFRDSIYQNLHLVYEG